MMTVRGLVTQSNAQEALGPPQTVSGAASPDESQARRRSVGLWLFVGWAVLSLCWTGYMLVDLYNRAADQASMSREVELELDSDSCHGGPCQASLRTNPQDQWSNIAETYLEMGYVPLLEWTVLPPAVLLAAGLGGMMALRFRRPRLGS